MAGFKRIKRKMYCFGCREETVHQRMYACTRCNAPVRRVPSTIARFNAKTEEAVEKEKNSDVEAYDYE
jgi:hypothetical protein